MSDTKSKPSIPAWQRAQQTSQEEPREASNENTTPALSEAESESEATASIPPDESATSTAPSQTTSPSTSPADQLETMKTFLQDSTVQNAPLEKKRAFFASKGIPHSLIDQVLTEHADLHFRNFESFKQQQAQSQPQSQAPSISTSTLSSPPTPQQQQQQQQLPPPTSSPPIITYPEYLIEAHKPTPLITLSRLWNTAQFAAGISTLIYGASTFLIAPMTDSLTEARHDFAQHSQAKIEALNEKLAGLVSKQPAYKASALPSGAQGEDEDTEDEEAGKSGSGSGSEMSDPTELYHRDMGTQTSPLTSRRPSTVTPSPVAAAAQQKKDPTTYQVTGLEILTSHLSELLTHSSEKQEVANKARQEKMSGLRHYLDTLMFASGGISMWSQSFDDVGSVVGEGGKEGKDGGKEKEREDAGEELKREIRGVKGVLLSAKRFPGVGVGGVGVGRSG